MYEGRTRADKENQIQVIEELVHVVNSTGRIGIVGSIHVLRLVLLLRELARRDPSPSSIRSFVASSKASWRISAAGQSWARVGEGKSRDPQRSRCGPLDRIWRARDTTSR